MIRGICFIKDYKIMFCIWYYMMHIASLSDIIKMKQCGIEYNRRNILWKQKNID